MNTNNKQPDPQDSRNIMIFMVVTVLLYFGYDHFIMKPHMEAVEKARAIQADQLAQNGGVAPEPAATLESAVKTIAQSLEEVTRLDVGNDLMRGSITLTGGRLDDIVLKDYYETLAQEEPIHVLAPKGTAFPRGVEYGWVAQDPSTPVPDALSEWRIAQGSAESLTPTTPVTMEWSNDRGLTFIRRLSLDDQYLITVEQSVRNQSGRAVTLFPYALVVQKGVPPTLEQSAISHEGMIAFTDGALTTTKYKKMRKEKRVDLQGADGWIGITDKYWLTALLPAQGAAAKFRMLYTGTPPRKKQADTGRHQVDFTGDAVSIAAGQTGSYTSHIFAGPKKVLMLKDYAEALGVPRLDLAVDFGMFWFFTVPFFYGLHYLALFTGNVGVAIILLTLIIRGLASPLTYTSYKSFAKMKKVMPQVQVLREKHGEDKEAIQKDMLALYQREGVNPAAGCFPMLLQIPIFFAFYKILFITLEVRHEPFFGWIQDLSAADPTSIFNLFGLIPWDPPGFLVIGIWPCLMFVGMNIQRKLNPPPTDQLQRDMARWFPLIMVVVMAHFASGLVIYWTVSAFFGIAQQMVIMRKMGVPIHLLGESDPEIVEADEPVEKVAPKEVKPTGPIKPPKPKRKKKR